jgi:hypothetical protein
MTRTPKTTRKPEQGLKKAEAGDGARQIEKAEQDNPEGAEAAEQVGLDGPEGRGLLR